MSHVDAVFFPDFANAMHFLRSMGCGVVRPDSDSSGYIWESEGTPLNAKQKSYYDAYKGIDSIWHDDDTGLTWLYSSVFTERFFWEKTGEKMLTPLFAGFSDWRVPTLTELKTLRSNVQDKNGLWRTPALAGKARSVLRSGTDGLYDREERRDWDFAKDEPCENVYRDSQIAWNSHGNFAGFEGGGGSSTNAETIYVRGATSNRPIWLQAQVQWSENNRVDDFPATEKTIERLSKLRVRDGNFPPELNRLTGLRALEVSNSDRLAISVFDLNALESLKWIIGSFSATARQEVHLSSKVGDLKRLRQLSVEHTIEHVPDSLCDLENLEELSLCSAASTLPSDLGRLSKLRSLRLRGKLITELPTSVGKLSALRELCINAKSLQHLPEEIGFLQSLRRLDMSGCSLQRLPSRLADLRALQSLSLDFNQISEVPAVVWELSQLEELDLSHNPLTAVPSELENLKFMKSLNLRGLPIVEVPVAIRKLGNLEVLNLSGTQIREIPDWIWEMKSLRRLRVADTWKLPRREKKQHTSIKVETYDGRLDTDWLKKMGKPDRRT